MPSGETLTFRVMPEEYLEKMVDQSMIKVYAVAFVRETRQGWCEEDDFMMEKPRLNIQVTKLCRVTKTTCNVL